MDGVPQAQYTDDYSDFEEIPPVEHDQPLVFGGDESPIPPDDELPTFGAQESENTMLEYGSNPEGYDDIMDESQIYDDGGAMAGGGDQNHGKSLSTDMLDFFNLDVDPDPEPEPEEEEQPPDASDSLVDPEALAAALEAQQLAQEQAVAEITAEEVMPPRDAADEPNNESTIPVLSAENLQSHSNNDPTTAEEQQEEPNSSQKPAQLRIGIAPVTEPRERTGRETLTTLPTTIQYGAQTPVADNENPLDLDPETVAANADIAQDTAEVGTGDSETKDAPSQQGSNTMEIDDEDDLQITQPDLEEMKAFEDNLEEIRRASHTHTRTMSTTGNTGNMDVNMFDADQAISPENSDLTQPLESRPSAVQFRDDAESLATSESMPEPNTEQAPQQEDTAAQPKKPDGIFVSHTGGRPSENTMLRTKTPAPEVFGGMDFTPTPTSNNEAPDLAAAVRRHISNSHLDEIAHETMAGGVDDHSDLMKALKIWNNEKKRLLEELDHIEREFVQMEGEKDSEIDKLHADNTRMAYDLSVMKSEYEKNREQIEMMTDENLTMQERIQDYETRWEMHIASCPDFNPQEKPEEEDPNLSKRRDSTELNDFIVQERDELRLQLNDLQQTCDNTHATLEISRNQIEDMMEEKEHIIKELSQLEGRLDEERHLREEIEIGKQKQMEDIDDLQNQYDMLFQFAKEQADVIEQAQAPDGADPEEFNKLKKQKSIFMGQQMPRKGSSFGNLGEFAAHMARLSNMSEMMRQSQFQKLASEANDVDSVSNSSFYTASTRFSFQGYHSHDALREFFFLLCMCVKLNLAQKYGISPDVAPNNAYLWQQVLNHNILFHEYYEYLTSELTSVYEHKATSGQGKLHKIVVTNPDKIKAMKEKRKHLTNLHRRQRAANKNNRHISTQSIDAIVASADRTTFSPNDLFGGHMKITTRKDRAARLSQSSRADGASARPQRQGSDVQPGADGASHAELERMDSEHKSEQSLRGGRRPDGVEHGQIRKRSSRHRSSHNSSHPHRSSRHSHSHRHSKRHKRQPSDVAGGDAGGGISGVPGQAPAKKSVLFADSAAPAAEDAESRPGHVHRLSAANVAMLDPDNDPLQ